MNDPIKVHVVRYGDCSNLILRYRDPLTGRQVREILRHGQQKRRPQGGRPLGG